MHETRARLPSGVKEKCLPIVDAGTPDALQQLPRMRVLRAGNLLLITRVQLICELTCSGCARGYLLALGW
jgi:hypothetical protein